MARKRSRKTKKPKDNNSSDPESSEANRAGLIRFIERWLELIEQKQSSNNRVITPPTTVVVLPLTKRRAHAAITKDASIDESSRASIEEIMECNSGNDMEVSTETEKPSGIVLDTPSIEGSQLENFNEVTSWTNDTSKEESWFDSIITSDYGGSEDFNDFK